jgi:membrane associated rhomboid family serine protease
MNTITDDIKRQFQSGSMVTRIIMVNLALFVFFNLLNVLLFLFEGQKGTAFDTILEYFMVSSEGLEILLRPWSLFTNMFLHMGFMHFLFNMLYLYWFGRIFQELLGNNRVLGFYVLSGLGGVLAFFLSANLTNLVVGGYALGASAAIMGIVIASATIAPNHQLHLMFIGPVKLMYIALVVVFLDLIAIPGMNNTGGHLAHLGGAATGFFLAKQLQKDKDWAEWFNNIFDKVMGWLESVFSRRKKPTVVYKNPNKSVQKRQQKSNNSNLSGQDRQAKIDSILDKIKVGGYENLTDAEKEFLFKVRKDI